MAPPMHQVSVNFPPGEIPMVAVRPDGPRRQRLRIEGAGVRVFLSVDTTVAEGLAMAIRAGVLDAEERRCPTCEGSGLAVPDADEPCPDCGGVRTRPLVNQARDPF